MRLVSFGHRLLALVSADALGRIIISVRVSLQTAINSLLGLPSPHARSEVVGQEPSRRLAVDSPFCYRWRVASSRWLALALQLTMIRLSRRNRRRAGRTPFDPQRARYGREA